MKEEKKLSFIAVMSSVICVVFLCEAAAPAAALGNQQFFWWGVLIVTFLLPYGLVVAELGTTYDGEGGIYDWIREGLGDKWAARISWYYWVNFPFWIASLATMFPDVLGMIFGVEFGTVAMMAIELVFVWVVVAISFTKISDSEVIMNGGAIVKVAVAVAVGILGIWFAVENGFANDMSASTFLPDVDDLTSLNYLSIIIFNFMGFEVICTFTDDMADPKTDVPKAIVVGGLAIAALYLFCGFGIGAAIETDAIDPDYGMLYAVQAIVGDSIVFKVICALFLVTLFANMVSWSLGVNSVARYAAEHGNMPKVFAYVNPKTGLPDGANIMNGVVASLILCIQLVPVEAISDGVFWMLFSTSVVFLLLTYVPMFPAFLKLRQVDPDRKRIFEFPFKGVWQKVMLVVPAVVLVLTVIASLVPLAADEVADKIPMLIGFVVILLLGEVVRIWSARDREVEYQGLTPELAAERLAAEAAEAEAEEAVEAAAEVAEVAAE